MRCGAWLTRLIDYLVVSEHCHSLYVGVVVAVVSPSVWKCALGPLLLRSLIFEPLFYNELYKLVLCWNFAFGITQSEQNVVFVIYRHLVMQKYSDLPNNPCV